MRHPGLAHAEIRPDELGRTCIYRMSLKDQVVAALKKVYDPEMPINIYELGLIYDVAVDDAAAVGQVAIRMTLTAPNCPVAGSLPAEVERAVRAVPGVTGVKLDLTFDPPWSKDRMSEAAKLMLGLDDLIPIIPIARLRG
jgi:FeS assembly SUF system protein